MPSTVKTRIQEPSRNLIEKDRVDSLLLQYAFSQSLYSQIAALICATVIMVGLYYSPVRQTLFVWYFLFLGIAFGRIILTYFFRLKAQYKEIRNYYSWKKLFVTGVFLGGFFWGLMGIILFPYVNHSQQTLCILALAGVTAGALPALAPIRKTIIGYYCLAILPYIVAIIFLNNFIYTLFGIMLLAYFFYIIFSALRMNILLKNTIRLQIENDKLILGLEYCATHDDLTGLYNRLSFFISLSHAISRAERSKESLCLFYIDLDNFKEINDRYGHDIGDRLLKAAAKRLKKTIRSSDFIARLGGDEYIILIENVTRETAILVAQKICHSFQKPFIIRNLNISATASIGISFYPEDGCEPSKLIHAADQAMYYTKHHGKNAFNLCSTI
jgi:diguanylate cyclase (GGDEF)-like protein